MKSSKRLDSVIFQLTPTRTRCDLVISANGKTEKVASGLLLPFLAHLKTAQDQIDKGGYSILLEPCPNSDTTWFTKGTVERFVRFVSNPEILERVYSLQSEILQLEKAIDIQSNNSMDLATMKEHQEKSEGNKEGIKSIVDASEENAIVLYKPETHPLDSNGSIGEHGNSKVQFLKVLETRKNVMHKEHGMAFARAVAAGFDIDHMAPLLSFAECFGASRLMEACLRFIDLWKQKHETGQWVEVETAESMTSPPNFPAINASGIIISGINNQQVEPHGNLAFENNGKPVPDSIIDASCDANPQAPAGQQEYLQGHFSYPVGIFPSWPANSPPGALPLYQQYPMQGVPFYHPYPGSGPFYPPPHPPVEDSGQSNSCRGRRRRLSMGSRDSDSESEELVSENGASQTQRSRKKAGKSLKKQPGVVVIRNINYVSSKVENSFESESEEGLDSGNDEETENKNFSSFKRVGSNTKSMGELNSPAEEPIFVKESGHWEAFQNFLLRDFDEKNHGDDHSMFGLEKNNQMKRRQNIGSDDPLACVGREPIEAQRRNISELRKISGNATRMLRSSNDDGLISREGHQLDNQLDVQFTEMNGRKLACRNNANDDLMTIGREGRSYASHLGDLLSTSISHSRENVNCISKDMTDESFIVPMRSMSLDQDRINERININMNSEVSAAIQKSEDSKIGQQANYEPDYLSLMPERGTEKGLMGYNPTLEYEMQVQIGDSAAVVKQNKKAVTDATQLKKTKTTSDSSDKKKIAGQIRKGKSLKSAPLEDARARAEKLRSYKADLQKLKKEKEEEQQRRLDALKNERQKRIAARGTSKAVLSPSPQQTKRQLPTKTAISSYIGSKFSDAEPKSSSPLQRSKLRTLSLGTIESQKASKTTKSANDIALPKNRLTRSVPSLPESKKETKEVKPDPRDSMTHLRRLSEPKASSSSSIALVRTRTPLLVSKSKVSAEPESQKIAGIINLDKSKAATLPELKIKSYKRPLETVQNESSSKETSQKVNKHQNGDDNNPIIDKTVVMFEPPKTSTAVNHEKVNTGYTDKEPPRASSAAQTVEMPYQPPFARLSSVEDPCTRQSLYGVTPSMTSEKAVLDTQSDKALVSGFPNLKIKEILEAPEKPQVKDSPRGFKRLLNFGKKSHSSAAVEQNLESDKTRANSSQLNDNATYAAASSEVHSLKNLISQDGSSAGGTTTNKSSRHFSLLSPFRSKTSEKKSAA